MAEYDTSRESGPMPPQPVPLGYARRDLNVVERRDGFERVLSVGLRAVFALGAGLFMCGLGNGWVDYDRSDVGMYMGWGAALMALAMPWGWRNRQ